MDEISTAEIIPFPTNRMEQLGRERLARALAKLQVAAAEQETAVAAWRSELDRLCDGVGTLADSFEAYGAHLESARRGVDAVNAQARRLETWADGALSR